MSGSAATTLKKLNARLTGARMRVRPTRSSRRGPESCPAHEEYDRREYAKPWPVPPFGY